MARPSILYMTSCADALSFYIIGRETGEKKRVLCGAQLREKKQKNTCFWDLFVIYYSRCAQRGAIFSGKM